jgi:hypothetical protein
MGNRCTARCSDLLTCFKENEDDEELIRLCAQGKGRDINDVELEATQILIEKNLAKSLS